MITASGPAVEKSAQRKNGLRTLNTEKFPLWVLSNTQWQLHLERKRRLRTLKQGRFEFSGHWKWWGEHSATTASGPTTEKSVERKKRLKTQKKGRGHSGHLKIFFSLVENRRTLGDMCIGPMRNQQFIPNMDNPNSR